MTPTIRTDRGWTFGHVQPRLRQNPDSHLPTKIIPPTKMKILDPYVRTGSQGWLDMSKRPTTPFEHKVKR